MTSTKTLAPKWSDATRNESATMEIIGRESYADGSVYYEFRATWYQSSREYFVKIDGQGNANGCSCKDGGIGKCWHQHELMTLEHAYQSH